MDRMTITELQDEVNKMAGIIGNPSKVIWRINTEPNDDTKHLTTYLADDNGDPALTIIDTLLDADNCIELPGPAKRGDNEYVWCQDSEQLLWQVQEMLKLTMLRATKEPEDKVLFTREAIDNMRGMLGTLPARTNSDDWLKPEYVRGAKRLKIMPVSPAPNWTTVQSIYKALVEMAVSTWGDGNIDGNWGNKWEDMIPAARYNVVRSVLTFQTLPTAMESTTFTFQVSGGPRHFFDQVARGRVGVGYASIGCRDSSKLSSEFVLYGNLYDMMHSPQSQEEKEASDALMTAFVAIKKAYQAVLNCGSGSYQTARSILPMSYHHQFTVCQNLLSLIGMFGRRSCLCEEEHIVAYAYMVRKMLIEDYGMTMLSDTLRRPCERSKRCHYVGTMSGSGIPGLFSNLFRPDDPECVRFVPDNIPDYAEFNMSCSSSKELKDMGVWPADRLNYTADYEAAKATNLSSYEIDAFEND